MADHDDRKPGPRKIREHVTLKPQIRFGNGSGRIAARQQVSSGSSRGSEAGHSGASSAPDARPRRAGEKH